MVDQQWLIKVWILHRYLDLWLNTDIGVFSCQCFGFEILDLEFEMLGLRGLDICGQATKGVWGMSWH